MADANPSGDGTDNPAGSVDQLPNPTDTNDNGSSTPPNGPTDAERKLQSERDQLRSKVEQLEGFAFEQMREKAVKRFLKENAESYPDVEVEDFAFAASEEDFEDLAKKAQDRMDRVKNKALKDVQNVPDDSLTDEQADKAIQDLRGSEDKPRGSFGDFLNVQFRRKR